MRRHARALLALLPISVLPNATRDFSPPSPRVDGYVITMAVTVDGGPMSGPMMMTLKAAGAKLRVEMDMTAMMGMAGDAGPMMNGAFMLPQDDGRIAMILPNMQNPMGGGGGAKGMGMIMDFGAMTGAMRDLGVSLEITDMKVSVENLGAGEAILGRKTNRYKLTQSYLMGGKPYSGVSEIWTTTEMNDAEAALKKFQETFGMNFVGAATSKEIQNEIKAKTPPGFTMRMTLDMATPEGPQKMKLEVTKAEKATIEEKDFEVPAGIQLMDMGAMMKRGH